MVRAPLLLVDLIEGLPSLAGVLAKRNPGQIAAGQVVALCLGLAALAFFGPGELLETAVELLDLSAHLHGGDDHFPRQVCPQVVGNHPFNVAVCGHQLEEFHRKRHLFHPHLQPLTPAPDPSPRPGAPALAAPGSPFPSTRSPAGCSSGS